MKKIWILIPLFAVFAWTSAQAEGPAPEEESTKLNLWIPGFLVKMAAEIAEDHVDQEDAAAIDMLHKFGTMTVCIREGAAYTDKTDKKMTRKLNRVNNRDYEQLVSVYSDGDKVNVSVKSNARGKIKRMVVLVDEPGETFVFVKMHCRIDPKDIGKIANNFREV